MVSWYCLAVVVPVAVHSMVEFPFAYAYFLVPVMFALGALDGHLGWPPKVGHQTGSDRACHQNHPVGLVRI
ncbi:Wzy polymerase domain-containing protein [Candidatus Aalborgicola defluviihabitans]|uniref:Wzy polymerase domain-containing protein n=1 Tax=Candidatus Aalborgicola defluviihabitans TaxID=3386187 RepID=UPI0039B85C69